MKFDFEGTNLAEAIRRTFERRKTKTSTDPVALTSSFMAAEHTQKQWQSFVTRLNFDQTPLTFDEIREPLRRFLLPVATALVRGDRFSYLWSPPGPWKSTSK